LDEKLAQNAWVTVIIVNYNGKRHLERSLPNVLSTRYPFFDIVIVDNDSKDGSQEFLKTNYDRNHKVRLIFKNKNEGLGTAQNLASEVSKGQYLAFLDNDARVTPDWLSALIEVMDAEPSIGAAQSKLLRDDFPNVIDSVGGYISPIGLLIERARLRERRDLGQWDRVEDIFTLKGAAMIFKKEIFQRAGGFDPDFFLYHEEPDLCWRIWDLGHKVVFVPSSIVYHNSGGSITPETNVLRYFNGTKNYFLMVFKNVPTSKLPLIVSSQVGLWGSVFLYLLYSGKNREATAILRGLWWVISHAELIRQKRNNRMQINRHGVAKSLTCPFTLRYIRQAMREYSLDYREWNKLYVQA
jgi:GT2 family glycosyltransferase